MPNTRKLPAILAAAACVTLLSACGGSDSDSGEATKETNTGVFVDSPVENLTYETPSQSGKTNAKGEFTYKDGETITFSIGDVDLPAAPAGEFMSPLTLVGTSNSSDTRAVNIARLLQTIDVDGDPANGITIDDTAHVAATGLTVDFSSASFDTDVNTLVNDSGSITTTLVTHAAAIAHLESQSRTLELVVKRPEGTIYDEGTRTLVTGAPYSDTDVSGKTYAFSPIGQGPWSLEFSPDGTGTITFSSGDTNPLSWHVTDGKVYYTETDGSGDRWDVVITRIEATSAGENVLMEISSPADQADFTNGAGLGAFTEAAVN